MAYRENLRHQFAFAIDDITTIGLREIFWDIHSGQEAVLAVKGRSQALGLPWLIYQPTETVCFQMELSGF